MCSRMKGPLDRTKVVVRHLPPTISQSTLMEQVDARFADRYNWFSFHSGKNSQKRQSFSRAYVDFKRPDDVIEFATFFDGHVFVNEKGTQFKTIVEYAPSQRVPKQWSKKDGREGTILKDPEYLEFLEFVGRPVENLPSAEIQLERREAERAGATKDAPIITPLMDYVRQKRAVKSGPRRSFPNGKSSRRVGATSTGPSSTSSRRGSEKRRISTTMYVMRDAAKGTSGKDKSTSNLIPKRDDQQLSDKSISSSAAPGIESLKDESGVSGTGDTGKKILLLKGKEKEIPYVPEGSSMQQSAIARQNHRREAGGRIIKGILLNKNSHQNQSSPVVRSEHHIQASYQDKDKRPPRPPNVQLFLKDTNGVPEDTVVGNDLRGFGSDKQEKRTRNKDRPDRGVWTPLRRSEGSHTSDESFSSSPLQSTPDSVEGSHKHGGRRGPAYSVKDGDGFSIGSEGKPGRRGGSSSYSSHEKQVWVQKSSAGS